MEPNAAYGKRASGHLNGDYSAPALEDAAENFQVDTTTVESIPADNGRISRCVREYGMPCGRGVASEFAFIGKPRTEFGDGEKHLPEEYAEDPELGRF